MEICTRASLGLLDGSTQGSLPVTLSGSQADEQSTWAAVRELLAVVHDLSQAVESAAPKIQDLISSCIAELSEVGPATAKLALVSAHKLTTSLGILTMQLDSLAKQQQPCTLQLPVRMLQQMLVDSLVRDVEQHLQELQSARHKWSQDGCMQDAAAEPTVAASSASKASSALGPTQPLRPSATRSSKKISLDAAQRDQGPALPRAKATKQDQETPTADVPTPGAAAALYTAKQQQEGGQPPDPFNQSPFEFCDFYQMWDIAGLRESAMSLDPESASITADATPPAEPAAPDVSAAGCGKLTGAKGSVPVMPLNVISGDELIASEQLGAGSFGSVHAGMWLGAPVAIKYLQSTSGTADNSSLREQLRQEVLLQAKCSHPNVVRFFAMCYNPPAIVMELCSGRSLAAGIRAAAEAAAWPAVPRNGDINKRVTFDNGPGSQQGLLLAQTRIELLRQAASAVMCMHNQAGLLHNDLRACNMLLDRTADGWQLKVADFGLAAELEPGESSARVKQTTNALWVAPEVLQSCTNAGFEVSKASDVYSLGCVMYECLTGRTPLWDPAEHPATADVRAAQVEIAAAAGQPVRLQYPPQDKLVPCPETGYKHATAIKSLLESCCSHQPQQRPAVAQVQKMLHQVGGAAVVVH